MGRVQPQRRQRRQVHAADDRVEEVVGGGLPNFSEHEVLASLCRGSFADFTKEFWDVVVPERLKWNWHMEYLCRVMQRLAERVFAGKPKKYDLIINISPGTS